LFAIAMATLSCRVDRRWFVSRHSAGSVAYPHLLCVLLIHPASPVPGISKYPAPCIWFRATSSSSSSAW
jgi:hypothetical protein